MTYGIEPFSMTVSDLTDVIPCVYCLFLFLVQPCSSWQDFDWPSVERFIGDSGASCYNTHCVSKTSHAPSSCYNFNRHELILMNFDKHVAEKVSNKTPHYASDKARNRKNHIFSLKCCIIQTSSSRCLISSILITRNYTLTKYYKRLYESCNQ